MRIKFWWENMKGRPRCRWVHAIKMGFKEQGRDEMGLIHVLASGGLFLAL
jgi:hypothetical protein